MADVVDGIVSEAKESAGTDEALTYVDSVSAYAQAKGLTINIKHVPSGNEVAFHAFLTSFSDDYKTDWESTSVYGRMDPIETFKSVQRVITVGWKVVSQSVKEAEQNLANCSRLMTYMYPAYDGEDAVLEAPPILQIKFSNLIQDTSTGGGLYGRVDGVKYAPVFDTEGFFDMGPNHLLPKTVQLDLTFHVFHTHNLGWSQGSWRDGASGFPYSSNTKAEGVGKGDLHAVGQMVYGQSVVQTETPVSGQSDIDHPNIIDEAKQNQVSE